MAVFLSFRYNYKPSRGGNSPTSYPADELIAIIAKYSDGRNHSFLNRETAKNTF
ncbi:hypothetical protein D2M30_0363 [Bacillus amyloliquefaciens]|nr:hypothetical protein D2M30_0363 [Bacillus amyloliquefaciens]